MSITFSRKFLQHSHLLPIHSRITRHAFVTAPIHNAITGKPMCWKIHAWAGCFRFVLMCAKWDFVCLHEHRIYVKTWSQTVQLLCAVSLSWTSHNLRHNVRRSLLLHETSSSECMLTSRDIWDLLCRGKNMYHLLWCSVTYRLPGLFIGCSPFSELMSSAHVRNWQSA